jgi:hypothetical protein
MLSLSAFKSEKLTQSFALKKKKKQTKRLKFVKTLIQ